MQSSRSAPSPSIAAWISLILVCALGGSNADVCECDSVPPSYNSQQQGSFPNDKLPLHNASAALDVGAVRMLLRSHEVDPNSVDRVQNMTALHVAFGTTSDPFWHPYKERMYQIVEELLAAVRFDLVLVTVCLLKLGSFHLPATCFSLDTGWAMYEHITIVSNTGY